MDRDELLQTEVIEVVEVGFLIDLIDAKLFLIRQSETRNEYLTNYLKYQDGVIKTTLQQFKQKLLLLDRFQSLLLYKVDSEQDVDLVEAQALF